MDFFPETFCCKRRNLRVNMCTNKSVMGGPSRIFSQFEGNEWNVIGLNNYQYKIT